MDNLQDQNICQSFPPTVPDGGPGEALPIVTVEVVPGLSLGSPSWPLLARTEWQVWLRAGAAARERQAGLWKIGAERGCPGPSAYSRQGPKPPSSSPSRPLGAGGQAVRVRGLPVRSPGASATRVDGLQSQGWKQAQASRHSRWEGPGPRQPRGPFLTATSAATAVTPVRGYPRQLAALG